jgi:hypothetical protein
MRLLRITPPVHLRVLRVLDLEPGRTATVRLIDASRPLRNDPLQVPLAARNRSVPRADVPR